MENMTEDDLQVFVNMLTGKSLPAGMRMENQPAVTAQQAMSVIWYLQVHLQVIPDHYEMCYNCHYIFNSREGGSYVDIDTFDAESEWYEELGVTAANVNKHVGKHFCESSCEAHFWTTVAGSA